MASADGEQLTIIRAVSVAVAVVAVLRFTKLVRKRLGPHHIMAKLVAFKLIVFLDFIQEVGPSPLFSHDGANQDSSSSPSRAVASHRPTPCRTLT